MPLFKKKDKDKKEKIKFKDRPLVKYIKENAPKLLGNTLDFAGELTGITIVEKLGEKIAGADGSEALTPEQQIVAMELYKAELEHHAQIEGEITKRWQADMLSDNTLSKIARPLILLYSWLLVTVVVILDFCGLILTGSIVTLVEILATTVTAGYFGLRTIEKRNQKKYLTLSENAKE